MGLKDDLLHGIYNYGFEKPSAIQQRAVMPIINGRDVISQAQSGTRKTSMIALTICQVVDTASKEVQALILSPTRELAPQTEKATRETGALQAAKNKLEKQVEELTWRLQLEKQMRVDLEEAKTQENAKLQSALQDIQLQFKETKELLAKEREAAKKAAEVVSIIQEVSVVDLSEECLRKERQRVSHYLHSSSETRLLEKVQHELLVTYANRLLEKEHSGCRALFRDDKVEDLSRMYRLYCKIPRGLEPVANVFKQHVTAEGTALVQQAEDAYKYTPTYYKAWVVKQKDMDKLHHGWDDSYNYLWKWNKVLDLYIPGSITDLEMHPTYFGDDWSLGKEYSIKSFGPLSNAERLFGTASPWFKLTTPGCEEGINIIC
ncbi:hypothetical protein PVK06_005568 [Gossypium arboreum]|uniref:DEAD-box RNA helicase Q domain-containing protein n=1 Tax=Gossypium arboreum TaxID=29729 RepID=A0ABR0QWA3_GOSAR|nr:hypothetical protein PVK06_005568 [Gossypium arboreum]